MQWLFWNPWSFLPIPGLPSHRSYLVASERWAPALRPDSSTDPGTDLQDMAPMEIIEAEEEEEAPPQVQASSSSSPDMAISRPSILLPQDDFRAHQELLKQKGVFKLGA